MNVIMTGPMLTRMGLDVLDDISREIQVEIGRAAFVEVHSNLNARIRHPTPYYETQIVQQRLGSDEVVHDRGIVYGPWLEGTSRRNSTTRFKGYFSFRRARQTVQLRASDIAGHVVARNMNRLGG